jgi:hypothetical protein
MDQTVVIELDGGRRCKGRVVLPAGLSLSDWAEGRSFITLLEPVEERLIAVSTIRSIKSTTHDGAGCCPSENRPHGHHLAGLMSEDLVPARYVHYGYRAAVATGDLRSGRVYGKQLADLAACLLDARDNARATSALARVLRLSAGETRRWCKDVASHLTAATVDSAPTMAQSTSLVAWAWAPLPFQTTLPH